MSIRTPACSVVIPTRNCLEYLPIALASINMQRIAGLEVIVIDDGSSDGTAEWLASGSRVDATVKVIETGGIGVARARNRAIEAASGELIAFLDADDYWWPGKLSRQLEFHRQNPDIGLSFTDYVHVTPDGRTHGTCYDFWSFDFAGTDPAFRLLPHPEARLLATNVVGCSTVVARKSVIERVSGFSVDCKSAEDWDMWLRMAAVADVAFSGLTTMTYLMRPNGETSARGRRIEAMAEIVARYVMRDEPSMRAATRVARGRLDSARAELLSADGEVTAAALAHARALLAAPSRRGLKSVLVGGRDILRRRAVSSERAPP